MEHKDAYPAVDEENGFCGHFDRIDASLIEETEYCGVCNYYHSPSGTCRYPEKQ